MLNSLPTSLGSLKEYSLILQTDDNFYSAKFRMSQNDTYPKLDSISDLSHPITNTKITALATCEYFLYFATDEYIDRLAIRSRDHRRIKKSTSYNNIAIDPYCRSLFLTTSSSLQISASNTSSTFLTPRVLTSDMPGDVSISSLSYDYINYQLIYTTSNSEVYQLDFNSTSSNRVQTSEKRRIIGSAVSHTHLYTLDQNTTHTTLWRSNLTRLRDTPTRQRVWDNSESFREFTVTTDGEWLFYIDPITNKLAATSSSINNQSYSQQPVLFKSPAGLRALRLIPNTQQRPFTDPCLTSSCTHLCLPLSTNKSVCACTNGEQQLTQSPTCSTDLYGASLVAASDGIHVLRTGDKLSFSLLPFTGYSPDTLSELTASGHWVYWSQEYSTNNIPYSQIRSSSVATGHTKLVIHELLGQVSGLVVERISDSLYWSDKLLRRIEVSRTNGEYRKVLFDNDVIVGAPSNLVADLEDLRLYWIENRDGVYRILSAPMDASADPELVIEERIGVITSLAVDQLNRVLYWSSPNSVKGFDLLRKALVLETYLQANSINRISVMDGSILNLRSENLSSVFTSDSLLLAYTDIIHSIAYVPSDRDRTSPCRDSSGQLVCPHLCLPSPTGKYSCVCATGFELKTLNGVLQCEEIGETLYLSQPGVIDVFQDNPFYFKRIRSLDTRIRSGINVTASAITGDVRTGYVYWSNTHEGVIGRARKDGSDKQVVLEGYHSVHGLSFDPLSGNLYWSDSAAGLVGILTADGSLQKVLIHARDRIPYSLATNARSGEVYFSTRTSPHSIITMHGNREQMKTLVGVRGLAVALSVDVNSSEIYWARNASLENQLQSTVLKCTIPDCTDATFLLDFSSNIHQISVGSDRLYSVGSDRLYSVGSLISEPNKFFLRKHYLKSGTFEAMVFAPSQPPGALHFSHLTSQPKQHYCAINNGGCSHFCLLARPSSSVVQEYTCECPVHMKLASDERTCEPRDTYLFVLTEFYILALSKYPQVKDEAVPIGALYSSRLISFDPIDNTVYWVDEVSANNNIIKSFGLNKGEMNPKTVAEISTLDSQLFNFQIDWVGKYAIWTRENGNSIEFTRLDNTLSGHILFNNAIHPRALAIDPTTSRLFFSDWSSTPSIRSVDLDGNNLEVLVSSQYVSRPSSLVYSHKHSSIFWYDYDKLIIAQYNFTTKQVYVLQTVSKAATLTSLGLSEMKIAVSGEEIVWWEKYTEPVSARFYYYNLLTGATSATDVTSVGKIYDMVGHTLEPEIHHRMHQCLSSDCKSICLNRISTSICTCPLYTNFSTESMSCKPNACPYIGTACTPDSECGEVSWRCDGREDCIDGSDELNCTLECHNQFQCISDGLCLPLEKQCDGTADCSDRSDESNCPTTTAILPTTSTYSTRIILTTVSSNTDQLLLIYIILALVVVIILLICIFPLMIVASLYLMRPHHRRRSYKVPVGKEDVENNRGSPSYDTEIRSIESTCPIIQPNRVPVRIPFTPTSSNIGNCSLDLYSEIERPHYFPTLLPPELRNGSASFDMKTVDLVSDVTDASLERKSFDYELVFDLRVPPPSVITNNSEVLLSVSQQDIPRAIESSTSGLSHMTTSRSQPFLEYAHPNSEISTALSSTDCSPERPRLPSYVSSHYTINTTNKSYTNQQGILHC